MPRHARDPLGPGLYEELLTPRLTGQVEALAGRYTIERRTLSEAEAADRLALHLARLVERAIGALPKEHRTEAGARIVRGLAQHLDGLVPDAEAVGDAPLADADVLLGIHRMNPDGTPARARQPLIPLLDTALLSNARGEPALGKQLLSEIDSADSIDAIVAFIRYSGIRPLLDALRRHVDDGRRLRILTTTYTRSTEPRALETLAELGAQIRVSYDTSGTRLHAKAWIFSRSAGTSTAYIGSSNLTHAAQVLGLEWNVRVSRRRNPGVLAKMQAAFGTAWESGDFVPYDSREFASAVKRGLDGAPVLLSPVEIRLEPFQERLLEQIEASRRGGHHRNLLVAATGTGKTVMAAVDYARLRRRLPRARLLFVAHREEILGQSLATFRHALRDPAFGELWVGGRRAEQFEHVFASIQSLSAAGVERIEPGHFDVVIIDEFHHAAAPSYEALLQRAVPRELLGLTATPERADGMPILHWFGDRVAAELRLWDAIDQGRLVPFQYYGIHDGSDLRSVPWRRGRGYDVEALTNVLTADHAWARTVVTQAGRHVADVDRMRALGFCVSVGHARFMAEQFRGAGIRATAVTAETPDAVRKAALAGLRSGKLQVVFSVDLFNEGVDVPEVDTLLMLRPTDSATVFLQQLGRGLRKSSQKAACTVLDFVGHQHTEFRFDTRYRALLGGTRRDVEHAVATDFPTCPRAVTFSSIAWRGTSCWTASAGRCRRAGRNWSRSCRGWSARYGGLRAWPNSSSTPACHWRISTRTTAAGPDCWRPPVAASACRARGKRRCAAPSAGCCTWTTVSASRCSGGSPQWIDLRSRLTAATLGCCACSSCPWRGQVLHDEDLAAGAELVWEHPQVLAEVRELLPLLGARIDRVHVRLDTHPDVPLLVHARYTREEILAAMHQRPERARTPTWREGVRWAADMAADLFLVTLDKTPDHFSPTTRYRDHAIGRDLFHWESQSTTSADSPTGRRYQEHAERGSHVLLFVRQTDDERAFWFLGPATYVSHEGERPMAIVWRLQHPLPGDLYAEFAAAAVA